MTTYSSSRRNRGTTIPPGAIVLLIVVVLGLLGYGYYSIAFRSNASERAGIAGVEVDSPNGFDPCADFRTARDHYENDIEPDNVRLTFRSYASKFEIVYREGREDEFIKAMERAGCK